MIKCGHCKAGHEDIAGVRACAKTHFLPAKKELALETKSAQYLADLAKVQTGTVVEEITKPVALVTVPEHRIKPNLAKSFVAGTSQMAFKEVYTNATPEQIKAEVAAITAPAPVVKKGQDLELGMYQVASGVYKVKVNKNGTLKYAEKLVISQKHVWDEETNGWKTVPKGKFSYAGGVIFSLTSEDKMDEAAAKAFHDATKEKYGQQYGFCCVCGKLLTVKKSIDAGIGPVCQSKL